MLFLLSLCFSIDSKLLLGSRICTGLLALELDCCSTSSDSLALEFDCCSTSSDSLALKLDSYSAYGSEKLSELLKSKNSSEVDSFEILSPGTCTKGSLT